MSLYVNKTTYVAQTGFRKKVREEVWVVGQGEWRGGEGGWSFILVGLHSELQCQVDKQDQSGEFKISVFAKKPVKQQPAAAVVSTGLQANIH